MQLFTWLVKLLGLWVLDLFFWVVGDGLADGVAGIEPFAEFAGFGFVFWLLQLWIASYLFYVWALFPGLLFSS
jgi:hypothetical protein